MSTVARDGAFPSEKSDPSISTSSSEDDPNRHGPTIRRATSADLRITKCISKQAIPSIDNHGRDTTVTRVIERGPHRSCSTDLDARSLRELGCLPLRFSQTYVFCLQKSDRRTSPHLINPPSLTLPCGDKMILKYSGYHNVL